MLERQREGIRKAQAAGKYLGRKPSASLKAREAIAMVNGGKSVAATAKALGIGRASVYRALERQAWGQAPRLSPRRLHRFLRYLPTDR